MDISLMTRQVVEQETKDGGNVIDTMMTLNPDVVVTVLEEGAVLLELQTKFFYSVNSTGWAIVQMFENGATVGQINARCVAWGAPAADMEKVNAFVQAFTDDHLVISEDGPGDNSEVSFNGSWVLPVVEKHKEPLQRVMVSAFDPSLPLAE